MTQRYWFVLASVALISPFNAGCQTYCEEGGRIFEEGDNWTCTDGCNYCGCKDGQVLTTAMLCAEPPGPAAGKLKCFENNFWHPHGETWVCADGCDECGCSDGELQRTARECSAAGAGGTG